MERAVRIALVATLVGLLLSFAASASAQDVSAGCTATVNGRAVRSLTEEDPVAPKGKKGRIVLRGNKPGGRGKNAGSKTETNFYAVVFGARLALESSTSKAGKWGGRVELPGYLTSLGAGTYRIEAETAGADASQCTASAYVRLKGGPLTFALGIGALLTGVGAAVALGARGNAANAPDKGTIAKKTGIEGRGAKVAPDKLRTGAVDLGYLAVLAVVFYLAYEELFDFGDSIGFAVPAAAAGASAARRVWVHGRVLRGFIGGFLFGVGLALVLHQLDVWPLDLTQALVFPVMVGIASAARAYIGSAFTVVPPPPEVDDRSYERAEDAPGGTAEDAPTTAIAAPTAPSTPESSSEATQVIKRPERP